MTKAAGGDVDFGPWEPLVLKVASLVAARKAPLIVGIAGGVGVGKSTCATAVVASLQDRGISACVLGTDAFLRTNAELAKLGLSAQKGFPESFDTELLLGSLRRLKRGEPVEVPVYSHETYDRVPGQIHPVPAADVVVLDGVNALQPEVGELVDLGVFLHAEDHDMRRWYVDRFLDLCVHAEEDDASFYRMFRAMSPDERRAVAEGTWDAINLVNLREHIAPTRGRADIVIEKGPDHRPRQ